MSTKTVENGSGDGGPKKRTIEGIYQKKTQLEHILLRPDTYIGSVEHVTGPMWIYDKEKQRMIQREITYVPGLYKIFDEILVNAADNKQRDPRMSMIKIDIDAENNTISVWNNGKGIPVTIHKDEKMYVPTMIFGHLLTSSNYDDNEEKVTGGRNGYGAKLCNIFSHRFTVETACKEYKKCLKQTWGNNMEKASEPRIQDFTGEDFTKVTFSPDLTKFKMESLDNDIVDLMSRRAYDVAASTRGVAVYLNGVKVPVKNFKDYVDLYIKDKKDDNGDPLKIAYEVCGPRWEVAVTLAVDDKGFQQMSFVNSIATTKGGRHVDHVIDLIVKQLIETLNKKNKGGIKIVPYQIKNHMWVFVNCLINNPTFDSQTKENMTLQIKRFGSKCVFSNKFIPSVTKTGLVEAVLSWAKSKADIQLQKSGSKSKKKKIRGIHKLQDANHAGSNKSLNCTLILTEGDSAKAMAVSGLPASERDIYGVYPLRGKLLNVREATSKQITDNKEIKELVDILGLKYNKKYETRDDLKALRYGKMMIMTDQDQDGSHIKGLLINFIHCNWPSLLKLNFIEEFITPIVKARKRNQVLSFFSMPEFEMWKKETEDFHTYTIKYYKGLGTSTAAEAKEYFQNMARHRIRFKYGGEQDDQNIVMAFSKKCVDQRKDWLTNHMEETKRRHAIGLGEKYLYEENTRSVTFSQFINLELVLFSNYDNVRSIPNAMDGLKPGQRKVLFTCFKRNDKHEVKVAQLAGSVAEHSAYHHGEVSLMTTIINLAQNFVGSNNINLLQPIGQFGTRLTGGKDSASPRYIFTKLSPLARLIFNKNDEPLLKYEKDDNQKIEPVHYIPIIPMVLVNGADGIGTGWMTKIPNYDPREIIENLLRLMDGADFKPMIPYYKNFHGSIEKCGDYRYVVSGEISVIGPDKVEITELPIGTWTQTYKESVLEPMLYGSDKIPNTITDYEEYNTDTAVHFIITMNPEKLLELEKHGLHKAFKLQTVLSVTSMCTFDENRCLKKYDNVTQIMTDYYKVRLEFYHKRKDYMEGVLQAEVSKLSNQARFILKKCDGELVIENKKKKDMIAELVRLNYDSDPVAAWKLSQNREDTLEEIARDAEDEAAIPVSLEKENYDYLLGMSMWSLTKEKKDELIRQRDEKMAELKRLQLRTPMSLWKDDLNNLLSELNKVEDKEQKEVQKENQKIKHTNKKSVQQFHKAENARRIIPIIDTDLKKKIDKAETVAKDKQEGIKRQLKVKKEVAEDKDEFDALVELNSKPLDARIGNSPEKINKKTASKKGMKQTTLPFKSAGKEKADKKIKDEDNKKEIDFESISPSPVRPSRRNITGKVRYVLSDEESADSAKHSDDDLNSDQDLKNDKNSSDSDVFFEVDKKAPPPRVSSEELFDSLIGNSNKSKRKPVVMSSSEDSVKSTPPKKVVAKRKTENVSGKSVKKPRKKVKTSSSDSDTLFDKLNTKKRQKTQSDLNSSVDDVSPLSRKFVSRARKPVSYAISDDDSDD